MSRRRTVPAGQMILMEGEAHTVFAKIISGVVKLTKTLDDGRQSPGAAFSILLFAPLNETSLDGLTRFLLNNIARPLFITH